MNVKTTKTLGKLIALSLITSAALHATNGDNLIAVGTKARGMGGVGIAMSHGAESGISNPALITSVESTEIGFGGTIFMPEIKTQISPMVGYSMPEHTSDADLSLIPGVSIAHKVDNNWYVGIGMWGTAGMGVDYSDITPSNTDVANMNMLTNLQLMQFAVPIAYKTEGLSLAIAPVVQYGNLDINYDGTAMGGGPTGAGVAQDFGFGYNLGLAYELGNGLTVGALYKSSIDMEYDNQLSTAMWGVGVPGFSDKLEQPSEYGVGIAYEMGQHVFAFDYKKIQWSDADGYKTFGWEDSDVYAFGYQYTENEWAVRLGYNYASSAVVELPNGQMNLNALFNMMNLLGFPATAEQHYTVGASYQVTNSFSVDLAYVYSPSNKETFDVSDLGMNTITTDHSESGISFQLAYKF